MHVSGETQLWNRGGSEPAGVAEHPCTRLVESDAVVWKSDPELPLSQNGSRVLGAPIGQPLYIVDQLASKSVEHELLFQRIPALLFCGATRANFWLRMIQPDLSLLFAERHDDRVWGRLDSFLHVPQLPHAGQCCACPLCGSPCELGRQFADGEAAPP